MVYPRSSVASISPSDRFSEETLRAAFSSRVFGYPLFYFKSIGSTNDFAKKAASDGAEEGTLIISEEQIQGKGRLGRKWVSPPGAGIWMSLILRPPIQPFAMAKITLIAAVTTAVAINKATGLNAGIKWPNDIIIHGKKACGILTEMGIDSKGGQYVILGIGINVNTAQFPKEIKERATSLRKCLGQKVSRREVLIRTILEFEELYFDFIETNVFERILNVYRRKSVTIGKRVKVTGKGRDFSADAIDVTNNGELLVRKDDGEMMEINSGEVSIRGIS